jgi:hypothetical protein
LPNGRYEPVDDTVALTIPAIIIDGNNFTQVMPFGMGGLTFKYKLSDGTITFTGAEAAASLPCEFKDGSLWYGGFEFKKTD